MSDDRPWRERLQSARKHREAAAAAADTFLKSSDGKWAANLEMISGDVQRATLFDEHRSPLQFSRVMSLWQRDATFMAFFISVLSASPFDAFFFETPAITKLVVASRSYEHVTVRAHQFAPASPEDFAVHLNGCTADAVHFANLGGDAQLVVPCARGPHAAYGHIAAFTRGASHAQQHELWQLVGTTLAGTLEARGDAPTWLNTEGSGVPWLHVRMDSRPKYYHHAPYKASAQ